MEPKVEVKAVKHHDVNGKPAWTGQVRVNDGMWHIARSGYGAICYMTPEDAERGARAYFESNWP